MIILVQYFRTVPYSELRSEIRVGACEQQNWELGMTPESQKENRKAMLR